MISILKNNKFLLKAITLSFAVAFYAIPGFSSAQQGLTISVTPTLFEMSANPGQVWSSSVKVVNINPYDLTVYGSVVNFAPQGETGQGKLLPVFENMTEGSTLAEWITIDTKPIKIAQEQSAEIPFSVVVPDDASPGGHFAAVLVSTQPPAHEKNTLSIRTAQIVTSLFFVRVSGDVIESGAIRSFKASDYFVEKPEATFELRFENKGNVHLQPRGDIIIYNMWGKERGIIPINSSTHFGNVLPDSKRRFEFSWSGEQSITDIGRYKAVASLAYGTDGQQFASASAYFWIVPIKSLLITLGSIVAFVLLVSWAIKLYVRRMLSMAGVPMVSKNVQLRNMPEPEEGDVKIGSYKRITAPVKSGYIDLRARLGEAKALLETLSAVVSFIISYKIFFGMLIVIITGVLAGYYFIGDVTDNEKAYDVVITNPDSELSLSSEEIKYAEITKGQGLPSIGEFSEQKFELELINSSGVSGTAALESSKLAKDTYSISSLSMSDNRIDKRSVIIYDQIVQDEALELSKKLGGVLLSARTSSSSESKPNITIFIGKDRIIK